MEKKSRKQFTFYASFRQALSCIADDAARLQAYEVICGYALEGAEPDLKALPEAVAVVFSLVRPNLDASRRKATRGANCGGKDEGGVLVGGRNAQGESVNKKENKNKREKEKETETEAEKETELETEKEREKDSFSHDEAPAEDKNPGDAAEGPVDNPPAPSGPPAAETSSPSSSLERDFKRRIEPSPSGTCLAELNDFAGELGEALCRRAFDIAVDNHNASWRYVRGILRNWRDRGVRSLAELEQAERRPPARRRYTGPPPATAGQFPLGDYEQGALAKMLSDMKGGTP